MMQLSVYKEHYKETIRLGVPIMLGQLGIIVVGFADNIMVGAYNETSLSGVASQKGEPWKEWSFNSTVRASDVFFSTIDFMGMRWWSGV